MQYVSQINSRNSNTYPFIAMLCIQITCLVWQMMAHNDPNVKNIPRDDKSSIKHYNAGRFVAIRAVKELRFLV